MLLRSPGFVAIKIEIALNGEFINVGIETQVSGALIIVLAVLVAIPKLSKPACDPQVHIIAELFSEKQPYSCLGIVEPYPGIEVSKIMGHTGRKAKFALLEITVSLGNGKISKKRK